LITCRTGKDYGRKQKLIAQKLILKMMRFSDKLSTVNGKAIPVTGRGGP
jgi:hypothetical protein